MRRKINSIYFVGIKGVGMTPLAIIAKEAGILVSGSDVLDWFITDDELSKSEIKVIEGFKNENIKNPDLVIYTGAHGGKENPEVIQAKEKGIECLNQGQALGRFQTGEIFGKKFKGISVTGSHGKTTTASMLATILKKSNANPSYLIGTGHIPSLGSSGHLGKGDLFVAEADEYFADVVSDKTPKFLYQNPETILITNIDYDHPDVYKTYDDMESAYLNFTDKLPDNGSLIVCGDGEKNRKFLTKVNKNRITFGLSPDNDYILEKITIEPDKMFFWVNSKGTSLGQFSTNVFGEHNAKNALGAIVTGIELGLSVEDVRKGIAMYKGAKRRLEYKGKLASGAHLYDDYAHHPAEINEAISALKNAYPKHDLVVVFQPHMYSRTMKFFDEFVRSFDHADVILISEIFPSFREPVDKDFSSKQLVDEINKRQNNAKFFKDLNDMLKYILSSRYSEKTIIVTMGAGDIYKIDEEILNG